jgi:hypothetical protein
MIVQEKITVNFLKSSVDQQEVTDRGFNRVQTIQIRFDTMIRFMVDLLIILSSVKA